MKAADNSESITKSNVAILRGLQPNVPVPRKRGISFDWLVLIYTLYVLILICTYFT